MPFHLPLKRPAMIVLMATVVVACLPGCFPYAASYVHLDADGATPVVAFCGTSGPPVAVRYERQGARLEVSLEPGALRRSKAAYVVVRVARGSTVYVNGDADLLSVNGVPELRVALTRTQEPLVDRRFEARKLALLPDSAQFDEVRFELMGMPAIEGAGTLLLPPFTINGAETSLPPIRFERRHYAGVAPLNC